MSGAASSWTLGGLASQAQPVNAAPQDGWKLAAVVDLNLDGNPDLVWTNNDQIVVSYVADQSGARLARMGTLPGVGPGWTVAGFADFNHDGHPDMLLQGPDSNLMVVYLNGSDGSTLLTTATRTGLPGWTVAALADLNRDGNADIVWQNPATQEALIWYLNPAGLLQSAESLAGSGESGGTLAGAADVDGDGNPDLIWSTQKSGIPVWYVNGAAVSRIVVYAAGPSGGARLIIPASLRSSPVVSLPAGPPERWNGINYSPRYHPYFRMLQDWNQYDSRLGKFVYQAAEEDLASLSRSGYNLLHLYLWDKFLLNEALLDRWCPADPASNLRPAGCTPPGEEPAGFLDFSSDPSTGPSADQFAALQDFVARAEMHGLYVALHFASGKLLDEVARVAAGTPPGSSPIPACDNLAGRFGNWAGKFISGLTPVRRNVLLWGLGYSFGVDPNGGTDLTGEANAYNRCFGRIYQTVDTIARHSAPPGMAGTVGLIGVDLPFYLEPPPNIGGGQQFSRPESGYSWSIASTQKISKVITDELTGIYRAPKAPDVYMLSLYNPNAADLARNLAELTGSTHGDPARTALPGGKLFPVEFATSSSGTGADSWGDAQTPTTTTAGQDAWLRNTLCAFRSAGVTKSAYWAMYDAASLWSSDPWRESGQELAWNGYWGLGFEQPASGMKPAWQTLAEYNQGPESLYCPANPAPNFNAWVLSDYITINQAPKIVWTATETTQVLLDGTAARPAWACDAAAFATGAAPFSLTLGGTCAFTLADPVRTPGEQLYTLTALNNERALDVGLKVQVGLAPLIQQVMGTAYTGQPVSVAAGGIFSLSGKGFALEPTNSLRWTRPGYPSVSMYAGDLKGHDFEQDAFHISATVDERVARGTWTVYIYNGLSPIPAVVQTVHVD